MTRYLKLSVLALSLCVAFSGCNNDPQNQVAAQTSQFSKVSSSQTCYLSIHDSGYSATVLVTNGTDSDEYAYRHAPRDGTRDEIVQAGIRDLVQLNHSNVCNVVQNRCEVTVGDSGYSVSLEVIDPKGNKNEYSYRHSPRDGSREEILNAAGNEKTQFQLWGVCQ